MPGGKNTFQRTKNLESVASHSASPKCPPSSPSSFLFVFCVYLHESQHATAPKSPSYTHREPGNPRMPRRTQMSSPRLRRKDWGAWTDLPTHRMSKVSRLARPSSAGAGSKLPSPRKECSSTAGANSRVRVLSVGEKLMRAGNDNVPNRQKHVTGSAVQDKAQTETQTESPAPGQGSDQKDQTMEIVSSKSRISPPKASSLQQHSVNSKSTSPIWKLFSNGLFISLLLSMHISNSSLHSVCFYSMTWICLEI